LQDPRAEVDNHKRIKDQKKKKKGDNP